MDNGIITFKLFFYFFVYGILPGFLVVRLFIKQIRINFFSFLPYSFVASLAILFPLIMMLYVLKWPGIILPLSSLALSGSLIIWAIIRKVKIFKEISLPSVPIIIVTLVITILAFIIIGNLNTSLDGDALYHLTFIRKLAENTNVAPYDAMFMVEKIPATYGYNAWYLYMAGLVKMTGLDSTPVWLNISAILIIIALFAWGNFAAILFKRPKYAAIALLAFIIFQGFNSGFFEWQLIPYPDQVARTIILPIVISLVFLSLKVYNKKIIFLISLASLAAVFIHLNFILLLFLILLALTIYYYISNHYEFFKKCVVIMASVFLPAVALSLLKIKMIGRFVSDLPDIRILRDDGFWVFKDYFIIHPSSSFDKFTLIFLIIFSFLILILMRKKWFKSSWFIFVALTTFLPFFILFNPILATYASKLFTYTYIHRLWRLVSLPLIATALVFVAYQFFKNVLRTKWGGKLNNNIIITLAAIPIFCLPLFFNHNYALMKNNTYKISKTETYFNGNPQETKDFLDWINNNLPKGEIFLSDPWTSYRISAFTNNYIVASLWQHFSPVVDRSKKTEEALFIITSNNMGEIFNTLNENKIKYIAVNRPYADYKSYHNFEEKFRAFYMFFTPIYENVNYAIFEYNYSEEMVEFVINSTNNLISSLLTEGDYKNALLKLKTLITLENDNLEYIKQYEKIRAANRRSLGRQANITGYYTGTKIQESSEFFPYPNDLQALTDDKIYDEKDYAAAKRKTMPNWFVINLQIPRNISSYEILWFSAKTSGETWDLYAEENGQWIMIDQVKNQSPANGYSKILDREIEATKLKFILHSAGKQNRLLIKAFNVY